MHSCGHELLQLLKVENIISILEYPYDYTLKCIILGMNKVNLLSA